MKEVSSRRANGYVDMIMQFEGRTYLARNEAVAVLIQERRWSAESYRLI